MGRVGGWMGWDVMCGVGWDGVGEGVESRPDVVGRCGRTATGMGACSGLWQVLRSLAHLR